jgi:hypothetical protein
MAGVEQRRVTIAKYQTRCTTQPRQQADIKDTVDGVGFIRLLVAEQQGAIQFSVELRCVCPPTSHATQGTVGWATALPRKLMATCRVRGA